MAANCWCAYSATPSAATTPSRAWSTGASTHTSGRSSGNPSGGSARKSSFDCGRMKRASPRNTGSSACRKAALLTSSPQYSRKREATIRPERSTTSKVTAPLPASASSSASTSGRRCGAAQYCAGVTPGCVAIATSACTCSRTCRSRASRSMRSFWSSIHTSSVFACVSSTVFSAVARSPRSERSTERYVQEPIATSTSALASIASASLSLSLALAACASLAAWSSG